MTFDRNRRTFLSATALGLGSAVFAPLALSQTRARIVIVGGGFGGASAARTLKALLPNASITLVEASTKYTACPFSNLVIGGGRDISQQEFGYDALSASGIMLINDRAIDVDPNAKTMSLSSETELSYDKLVLSPGVDLR
ncbi:MAG: FAD/NAD(P)-binding oxidoreductase [Pseudomonadota bacterium]